MTTNNALNVFDRRTLNADEKEKLDKTVDTLVAYLQQVQDLRDSMRETIQDTISDLNEGHDKELCIKASVVTKLARTKFRNDIEKLRAQLAEIEDGLEILNS